MIKGFDAYAQTFLADLSRIQERQARVQRQLSSGLRVSRPSDEPERVIDIVQTRSEIARATSIGMNLDRVAADVDSAEAAMRVAVDIAERARVLAAANGTGTAANRAAAAIEARQLHDQMVNLTRTSAEGRYVFSGDNDRELLYTLDLSEPSGVTRLTQATNGRLIEDVNGSRFAVSRTANEIFDARNADDTLAEGNAFHALHSLTEALEADDESAVLAASERLNKALEHLGRHLIFYGHAQKRIDMATTQTKEALVARKAELSTAQDTDISEALVELNMAGIHHDAALGSHARLPKTSLFDFLA